MPKTYEIKNLTPEQEKKTHDYAKKWLKYVWDDTPIDQEHVRKIVDQIYKNAELPTPPIYFVDSPIDAIAQARKLGAEVSHNDFVWCHHDAGGIGFLEFLKYEYNDDPEINKIKPFFDPIIEAGKHMGWSLFLDGACIVCKKPSTHFEEPKDSLTISSSPTLHNLNGPAVNYGKDNLNNIYAVGGVRVEKYVVENPEKITVEDIEKESNIEVKRVKIDQYDKDNPGRYIRDSGATIIDQNDFGTLYRKELGRDEPMMMVHVINSTAEPDGTFKDYFLRVDPNAYGGLRTVEAAIASTWRDKKGRLFFQTPEDYIKKLRKET